MNGGINQHISVLIKSSNGRLNEEIAEIEELYKYVTSLVKTKLEGDSAEKPVRATVILHLLIFLT